MKRNEKCIDDAHSADDSSYGLHTQRSASRRLHITDCGCDRSGPCEIHESQDLPRQRARGLGTLPKLRDEDFDFILEHGIVAYASSMDQAMDNSRCGSNPLVVKAVSIEDDRFRCDR